jgi:tRNA nucleotidyltransferase (CCA-adding enzyme)
MVATGEVDALVPERVWGELRKALETPRPGRFFAVLGDCGARARLFPEIDRLFGVPQVPAHHPEVDTGVHTLLVLDQAARLSDDPVVRFAALVHDLGKADTNPNLWPRHHGHERRSLLRIDELCGRLRVPNVFRELGILVATYHSHCHRAAELRPETLLRVLEAVDAFRRPERLDQFLAACEADARGRTGFEERPYPQAGRFRRAFDAARAVDSSVLAGRGLAGREFGIALRAERRKAVAAALD